MKEAPEEIVDSLHGTEEAELTATNLTVERRGKGGRQGLRRPSQDTARRILGHEPFQPRADADRVLIYADTELGRKTAQQPHGLSCRLARRIRRANGPLTLFLHSGQNNQRKTFRPSASRIRRCFASSQG